MSENSTKETDQYDGNEADGQLVFREGGGSPRRAEKRKCDRGDASLRLERTTSLSEAKELNRAGHVIADNEFAIHKLPGIQRRPRRQ